MACPKCGQEVAPEAVICPRCDFILDTSFLGDDILDETKGATSGGAVVLGRMDEPADLLFSDVTGSFLTIDTQEADREVISAPVYVGKSVQELMRPEAVLAPAFDIEERKAVLSPFELHVLSFIDGKRPVARLRKKTGLSVDDVRIAVGMLAEKGAVVLRGSIERPDMQKLLGDDFEDESDLMIETPDGDPDGGTSPDVAVPEIVRMRPKKVDAEDIALRPVDPQPTPDLLDLPDASAELVDASGAAASPWDVVPTTGGSPDETRADEEARRAQAVQFFELAHAELKKGNRVRAHMYAKMAAESNPEEARFKELLRTWATASRAAMSPEMALYADADLAEKQGNHQRALQLLEQALEAAPKAAHIHNRIGLLLAMRFKRLPEACTHLMKACELDSDNVVYKNNLGKIIALADARGAQVGTNKRQTGLLNRLKKALE